MSTPLRSGYSDFCRKLKSPKNMLFFLQTEFEFFRKIGRVFSTIQKILKINQKMGTPVRHGHSDFGQNWSFPKICLFFLQTDCFHERTKFWMFQKNWKGIFNISKNTQNQSKNGHTSKVRIQRFWFKLEKSPKHAFFFFKLIVFMKEQNFECFRRIGRVFSTFQKINSKKSTNKIATPVRSGYSDFGPNWKVPKTCLFFLQTDCFHERSKFWMFQKNWKGIFNISKNQPKKSTNKTKWPRR